MRGIAIIFIIPSLLMKLNMVILIGKLEVVLINLDYKGMPIIECTVIASDKAHTSVKRKSLTVITAKSL